MSALMAWLKKHLQALLGSAEGADFIKIMSLWFGAQYSWLWFWAVFKNHQTFSGVDFAGGAAAILAAAGVAFGIKRYVDKRRDDNRMIDG